MRTTIHDDGTIEVVFSRRNLRVMLAKLDGPPDGSALTILGPGLYPRTVLRAEEDDVHYAHPSRLAEPPGLMHPDTEVTLIQQENEGRA